MQIKINELTPAKILELSQYLKEKCRDMSSLEEVAREMMKTFYQVFVSAGGKNSFVLNRFFKTCDYMNLPADIKRYIQHKKGRKEGSSQNRYLTLLGTWGEMEEWKGRKRSVKHQAFPLHKGNIIPCMPILTTLLHEAGFKIPETIKPCKDIISHKYKNEFGIFCIEDVKTSKIDSIRTEFIESFGIKSVFGFGGIYRTNQIYSIIVCSREGISRRQASMFLSLNPAIKLITLRQEMTGNVFKQEEGSISESPDSPETKISVESRDENIQKALELEIVNEEKKALYDELKISNNALMDEAVKHKLAKDALDESEKIFHAFAASSSDAIIMIDSEENISFWNKSAESIFGFSKEEVIGEKLHKIIIPHRFREAHLKGFETFRNTGRGNIIGKIVCLEGLGKDGMEFPIELSLSAINRKGLWNAVGIIRNITEHKRAIKELEDLAKYPEENPNPILRIEESGIIIFANKASSIFLDLWGTRKGLTVPDNLHKIVLKTLYSGSNTNTEMKCRDSIFSLTFAPMVDKGCVNLYGLDITRLKSTEDELRQNMRLLRNAMGGIVLALAKTLELRDPYTAGHQQRVSTISRKIATEMGLPEERIEGVRVAGMVHDIGKIHVPAEILSKPGKLTENEFNIIKTHPRAGYEILKDVKFPWPVALFVLTHHERIDGSGYPSGLSGNEIPLEAKILCVADTIEAMISHRPYRAALGIDKAFEEISKHRGTFYDSDVVDACLRLFQEKGYRFE